MNLIQHMGSNTPKSNSDLQIKPFTMIHLFGGTKPTFKYYDE